MRIFFDTNIIMEYLLGRDSFEKVDMIVKAVEKNDWYCFISSASLYTMAYTIEKYLKQEDKCSVSPRTKTQRISVLRQMLWGIADMFNVIGMTEVEAKNAIANMDFNDIEDSMQYETALLSHCDVLLTLNIDDFENAKRAEIDIVTPETFLLKYM